MKTTLIIVAVIVCMVLAVIILPKWEDTGRVKEQQIKANAHSVQLMIEDYKMNHNGNKPAGLSSDVYIQDMENPYNDQLKNANTIVYTKSASATPWNGQKGGMAGNRGMIEYAWNGDKKSPYIITGYGKKGVVITIVEEK